MNKKNDTAENAGKAEHLASATDTLLPSWLPGLDLATASRRLGGNETLYRKLLGRFPNQYGKTISAIRAALAAGDHSWAGKQAHALAGVADNLGAVDLARTLRELQHILQTGSGNVSECLTRAEQALAQVISSIRKLGLGGGTDEPVSAPTNVVNACSDWLAEIDTIKILLAAHDLKARRRFANLMAQASEPALRQELAAVGQAIEGLQFAEALHELSRLQHTWGYHPSAEDNK